jgi:hypothetical protein
MEAVGCHPFRVFSSILFGDNFFDNAFSFHLSKSLVKLANKISSVRGFIKMFGDTKSNCSV